MKRFLPIGLLVVALAGCGGKSGTKTQAAQPASAGKTISVTETEFKLSPAKVTIAGPGTVRFDAKNAGKLDHALEIEGNGVEQRIGTISPGSSGALTVNLTKAGTYQLYCPVDNHRAMGMKATVVVGGAAAGGGSATTTPTQTTGTSGSTSTSSGYGY